MFFDAVGIIFDRKISPGGVFEKAFENTPGGAYFREIPVILLAFNCSRVIFDYFED